MRRFINICLSVLLASSIQSCSDLVKEDLDFHTGDQFSKVYIPQANRNPILKQVNLTDTTYVYTINAFYGGPKKAESDIIVDFEVDEEKVATFNELNSTNYQVLPASSYILKQNAATIKTGASASDLIQIELKPKGFLEPFISYLLPITITSASESINESLQTVYFEVFASYAPGEVPREKVLSLGEYENGKLFGYGDAMLVGKNPSGALILYQENEEGQYVEIKQIGVGFNSFNDLFYFKPDRIIGFDANITQYLFNQNQVYVSSRRIGTGWNIFQKIIPYSKYLIGVRPTGGATSYEYNEAGDINSATIKDVANDWNRYKQLIAYENSLLAIEHNGSLWQIPMSETGVPGTRVRVGEGWNIYKHIIVTGTDVLGLDTEGDLWRYRFNPKGFWPLEAN